ncbi:hypothetical protein Brms1b_012378 [Colletotrichum noveboracense]|nr:hypothetical protein COL940_013814 [Colletotrichum noveboracense]KAJ0271308.1 hypothetical protein CBS470a_013184 [Colletotrichum nupharicola]KAJ0301543.1 hypothetical protein Brms1b_012378 [Colletotrichum noveboracense]
MRHSIPCVLGDQRVEWRDPSVADNDGNPLQPTTTGHVTISTRLAMARRIAHFGQPTPSIIFGLLKSVIRIRTSFYEQYHSLQTSQLDPVLERSNACHKIFIYALSIVCNVLRGQKWERCQSLEDDEPLEGVQNLETMFGNMFSALSSHSNGSASDHEPQEGPSIHVPAQRQARKKCKRVRKPAKGKKGKKHNVSRALKTGPFNRVSLTDCDIDSFGSCSMATHALAQEWSPLRTYIQDIWQEVAYEGFNSVVAAAQSNMAVSMIQQAQLAIFAEFPNRDG